MPTEGEFSTGFTTPKPVKNSISHAMNRLGSGKPVRSLFSVLEFGLMLITKDHSGRT
jgi:hypothetical protein